MSYRLLENQAATDLVETAVQAAGLAYTKHYQRNTAKQVVVHFRFTDYEFESVDGLLPQITVINSVDKSSALKIVGGVFRLVCTNGLVAGTIFDSERIIHRQGPTFERKYNSLPERIVALIEDTVVAAQAFEELASQELTADQMVAITGNLTMSRKAKAKTIESIETRRIADQGDNVWSLFNLVNENLRKYSSAAAYTKHNEKLLENIQLLAA
jgi:hypothetical protein